MAILVLNPGSTTLKFAVVEETGTLRDHDTIQTDNLVATTRQLLATHPDIEAIGCRIVHGGLQFADPVQVNEDVIRAIENLNELAPLHNPPAVAVLYTIVAATQLPVVAVFDTAFHRTLPPKAQMYGLNYAVAQQEHLHRYGFHGIAHQSIAANLTWAMGESGLPRERLITCQLGGGDSVCAILNGKSVDTSMGFTPLEGLMMTTRSGDLDPGIILHLMNRGWDHDRIEKLLNFESGLAGLSGLGEDPRELLTAMAHGHQQARLALEVYAYRIAKYIAGYTVPLGGLDGLAFAGGIGQHSGPIRAMICDQLGHLGITLDETRNTSSEPTTAVCISADTSQVSVWAIPTEEEKLIAQSVRSTLGI